MVWEMENLDLFANLPSFIHIYDGLDSAHTLVGYYLSLPKQPTSILAKCCFVIEESAIIEGYYV